jgi:hypothetical protein
VQQSEKIRENVKKFCNSIYTALLIAWLLLCPGFVVSGGFFCPGFVCPGFVCLGFVRVPVVRFCVLRFDLKRDPYLVLNSSPIFECNNMTISRNMKVNFVAKPYPHLRTPRLRVTKFKPIRFQRKSFFFTFDEIEIPTKFYPNFVKVSMFGFSGISISMSKSELQFRFWFRLITFDEIKIPTKFHSVFVKISMSSKSEFQFQFRFWYWNSDRRNRNRNSDYFQ